jgi:hypothetical protein
MRILRSDHAIARGADAARDLGAFIPLAGGNSFATIHTSLRRADLRTQSASALPASWTRTLLGGTSSRAAIRPRRSQWMSTPRLSGRICKPSPRPSYSLLPKWTNSRRKTPPVDPRGADSGQRFDFAENSSTRSTVARRETAITAGTTWTRSRGRSSTTGATLPTGSRVTVQRFQAPFRSCSRV